MHPAGGLGESEVIDQLARTIDRLRADPSVRGHQVASGDVGAQTLECFGEGSF